MSAFGEAAEATSSAFGASGFEAKETTNGSAAPAAKPIATNMIRKKATKSCELYLCFLHLDCPSPHFIHVKSVF